MRKLITYDEFKKSLKLHNDWLNDPTQGKQAIFKDVKFLEFKFYNVEMRSIIFSNCEFSHCIFNRATMKNAKIFSSIFIDTEFYYSNFYKTEVFECSLYRQKIKYSQACEVEFSNCVFTELNYTDNFSIRLAFKQCQLDEMSNFALRDAADNSSMQITLRCDLIYLFKAIYESYKDENEDDSDDKSS